jgi:hypothetical protein
VLYGYYPVVDAAPMVPSVENKSVQELLMDRQLHTTLIKQHLASAHNRIKAVNIGLQTCFLHAVGAGWFPEGITSTKAHPLAQVGEEGQCRHSGAHQVGGVCLRWRLLGGLVRAA